MIIVSAQQTLRETFLRLHNGGLEVAVITLLDLLHAGERVHYVERWFRQLNLLLIDVEQR